MANITAFCTKVAEALNRPYGGLDYGKIGAIIGQNCGPFYCGKIPKDIEGEFITLNGVMVRVTKAHRNPNGKSSKHRVFVQCICNKWIPAGRITQHAKAKEHQQ